MSTPYFSVVIPLYNKEKFIVDTLNSVISQTFGDFEILVINDGSVDNSESKVLSIKDSRIKYFSQENQGASVARNFGIAMASGEFITFLDADDYWYPNFLEVMHRNIEQFPNEKVFSGAIEIETGKRVVAARYSVEQLHKPQVVDYFEASKNETIICTSCAAFHKNVFEKSGVFDPLIRSGQDTDLWIRIGLHYRIVFSPEILARYNYDAESLSKNQSFSTSRIRFEKYETEEAHNPKLKAFLDANRFSLAVKAKVKGDNEYFWKLKNEINPENLNLKKKVILNLPSTFIKILIRAQQFLFRKGMTSGIFK